MTPIELIDAYEKLRDHAIDIGEAHSGEFIGYPAEIELTEDKKQVIVSWEKDSQCSCCENESRSTKFPSKLLDDPLLSIKNILAERNKA